MRRVLGRLANSPRMLLITLVSNVLVSGGVYSVLERKGPIQGAWWAIVTASTVGYGDLYPASTNGRGVAAWLIITSIALVAMGTAQLTNHLLTDPNAWTHEEQEEIKQNIRAILANQELFELRVAHLTQALDAAGIAVPRETPSRRDASDNNTL